MVLIASDRQQQQQPRDIGLRHRLSRYHQVDPYCMCAPMVAAALRLAAQVAAAAAVFGQVAAAFHITYDNAVLYPESVRQRFFAADGATSVTARLRVERKTLMEPVPSPTGFVEFIVYKPSGDVAFPSEAYPGLPSLCCSASMFRSGVCDQPGTVIIPSGVTVVSRFVHDLSKDDLHVSVPVDGQGSYALVVSHCGSRPGRLSLSGTISIEAADGHLSAEKRPLASLYAILTIASLGVAVLGGVRMKQHLVPRPDLAGAAISLLLAALLLESTLWWQYYTASNRNGVPPFPIEVAASLACVIKRALQIAVFSMMAFSYGSALPVVGARARFPIRTVQVLSAIAMSYNLAQVWVVFDTVLSSDPDVKRYGLSMFFPLLFIDVVFFGILLRPTVVSLTRIKSMRPTSPHASTFLTFTRLHVALFGLMVATAGICMYGARSNRLPCRRFAKRVAVRQILC
ncbi:unnamed protein product (mitochondrion) [Plasmodiophora brassicae]|uniref:Uncharacterized protein n=1 Tax=Plasmodiophora brassicae TaxID=37360 RepID=A0A3P3XYC4_PLABS|nr:unnamed protein product [Plasmodiophora brassicae]